MTEQDMDREGFFGDDLMNDDNVIDAEPVEATAVEEVKSESESHAITTNSGLGGLGLDFSSLMATLPGVSVGDTGLTITRFPVERIKFSKGQRTLISILSDQVIVAKTHYNEDLGNFLCFGGACCDDDLARVRYVFPIIKYMSDPKGKPIPNIDEKGKPQHPLYEVTNMCLSVGQDTYDALLSVKEMKGSLTQFDFLVSCSDEQYQKVSIQEAGAARYKKDPTIVKSMEEFWKQNGKHILKSIARKITPEEYQQKKAADMSASETVDFEDVFGE